MVSSNFGKGLADLLTTRLKEYGEEKQNGLRLSNVGWPLRKLWYSVKGLKGEGLQPDAKVKFLFGDLVEALFILLAEQAGHSVTDFQRTVEVDGVPGHIDCVIDGVLVDVKSASTFSYKKFLSGDLYNDDPFGYVAQLTGYKQALGVERAGWLVIDKTLGHFSFVELKDTGYDIQKRIVEVREVLDLPSEPAHCYEDRVPSKTDRTGNRVLSPGCSYCAFREHCWRDANNGQGLITRIYSTGPKYFTVMKKEPNLKYDNTFTRDEFPKKQEEDI